MAIDNSSNIAQLNTTLPTNQDPIGEGAAQIRALKNSLKNTFPNVDKEVSATADRMNQIFDSKGDIKVGMIVMWDNNTIPDGWAACDGGTYNGYKTYDLRDKFILAKGDSTSVGNIGGTNNPDLSNFLEVDGHKLTTNEMPEHDHRYIDRYYPEEKDHLINDEGAPRSAVMDNDSGNRVGSQGSDTNNDGLLFLESKTEKTGGGATHSHGISTKSGTQFDNRPDYIVLQYIVFVGG